MMNFETPTNSTLPQALAGALRRLALATDDDNVGAAGLIGALGSACFLRAYGDARQKANTHECDNGAA